MTDEELYKEHVSTTGELLATADRVRNERKNTTRLTSVAAATASLAVLVAMAVVFVVVRERDSAAQANGDRLDAITVQLNDAERALNLTDDLRSTQLECQVLLDLQIRRVALEYLASLGELVVALASVPEDDPTRDQQIDDKIDRINDRLLQYRDSFALLEDWRTNTPAVCPLPVAIVP